MPRPRKYIHDQGKPVDGLSFHKPSKRFYSVESDGQRTYWGKDKVRAVREFLSSQLPARRNPPMTDTEAVDMLVDSGLEKYEVTTNLIEVAKATRPGSMSPSEADSFVAANPDSRAADWFKRVGFTAKPDTSKPKGSKERLSHCYVEWRSIMLEGIADESQYMKDVKRSWDFFTKAIGNKSISLVTADDFAKWRQVVTKEQTKRKVTAKWHNDQHKYIKTVFKTVKTERPSYPFPDGLLEWQVLPKRIKMKNTYVPKASNKQPLPVDIFLAVLAVADKWMNESTEPDTTTNSGRAKKRGSNGRHHRGKTVDAMFKLAANCGLDNGDTAAITWSHIKNLNGKMPYLDMPRTKIKNRFRIEVDRKIPLLPSTVQSLIRLQTECLVCDTIFRTVQGSPHSKNSVYDQLEDALIEAGLDPRFPDGVKQNRQAGKREGEYKRKQEGGWTFKHLRNIGGKKRHGITGDERDHFLGHVEPGQSRWYAGDADETYLLPLVNLIGQEYFEGEEIPQ